MQSKLEQIWTYWLVVAWFTKNAPLTCLDRPRSLWSLCLLGNEGRNCSNISRNLRRATVRGWLEYPKTFGELSHWNRNHTLSMETTTTNAVLLSSMILCPFFSRLWSLCYLLPCFMAGSKSILAGLVGLCRNRRPQNRALDAMKPGKFHVEWFCWLLERSWVWLLMVVRCVDEYLGSFLRFRLLGLTQAEGKAEAVLEVRGGIAAFLGHNLQVKWAQVKQQ